MIEFCAQLEAAGYVACLYVGTKMRVRADTTSASLDLQPVVAAKTSSEMWKYICEGFSPQPEQRFTNGADFSAWLKSLSRRFSKELVLIFDEADALAALSDELRSEFLGVLRAQKTSRAMRSPAVDPSNAPVKVWP
jgi:hypothetical protein